MEAYLSEYREYLKQKRTMAENSLLAYGRDVHDFSVFLQEKGIAISDTAHQVVRLQGNASDKFLQIVTPLDLAALLAPMPHCDVVMTTGELATDTLVSLMPSETAKPAIGAYSEADFAGRRLRLYRLPSSSRAYPLPLAEKAAAYARFFREIGLLEAF